MSAQRFKTGTQFSWQGQFYEVKRLLPGSELNIVNLHSDEVQTVTFIQLGGCLTNVRRGATLLKED